MSFVDEVVRAWLRLPDTSLDEDDAELQFFIACANKPALAVELIVGILKIAELRKVEENEELWVRIACGPLYMLAENFGDQGALEFEKYRAVNPDFSSILNLCISAMKGK